MSGYYPGYGGVSGGEMPSQPDFAAALSRLGAMTNEQLQELLDNDQKCEELVKSLDQVKALYSEKELLLASNKSLAEYNLSLEPKLREARNSLQDKHREATRLTEKVRILKSDVDSKAGNTDPDTLLALLQASGAEAEEESEKIAEEFLEKKIPLEEFLETFMEKRQISHTRRVKIDKMKELLEAQRLGGRNPSLPASQTSPTRRAPPPPAVYNVPPGMPPPTGAAPPNNWGTAAPALPYPSQPAPALPYPINPTNAMPSGPNY